MKNIMLLGLLVSLFSCNPVNLRGTFQTHEKIVLNSKSFWGNGTKITLSPYTFRGAQVSLSGRKVTLSVSHSGKTTKIEMPTKRVDLPSKSGSFRVPKSKTGQAYDMAGRVNYSEQVGSRRMTEYRSCTVVVGSVYKCNQRICGERKCCNIEVTRQGTEERDYYNVSYQRDVVLNLVKSGGVAATFTGNGGGSFKKYVGSSFPTCRY